MHKTNKKDLLILLVVSLIFPFLLGIIVVLVVHILLGGLSGMSGLVLALAFNSITEVIGLALAIAVTGGLLRATRVPGPFSTSTLAGVGFYGVTKLADALYIFKDNHTGELLFICVVSLVIFQLAHLLYMRALLPVSRNRVIAAISIITLPIMLFVQFAIPYIEDASYTAYHSPSATAKRATKNLLFKPYKPAYLPDGGRIAEMNVLGQDASLATAESLHVDVISYATGMSIIFHQSEPSDNIKQYVDVPSKCNLYNASEAITFKDSGYTPTGMYVQNSGCKVVGTTANGRTVYGESVPFLPKNGTFYYYTRIDGTEIVMDYRPWGENFTNPEGKLLKMVESLAPFKPSELLIRN